jgi:cellulose synthase/poly-beta-1,6-N-acetylglucosamine synthase-like glycosyltransferase
MLTRYPARQSAVKPVCSVCIANYNGVDLIRSCIESVLEQDCGSAVEIIVHDDASTDDSVAYIRNHYPQIELLAGQENSGFCVSNNRMVEIARGEFILLLNNDARLRPGALHALYRYASQQMTPGILGLPQHEIPSGKLIDLGYLLDIFMNPYPNHDHQRREVAVVTGACLWIPRSLWQELGGFPAWFHTVAEDIYLCCAARLLGFSVEVLPEPGAFRNVRNPVGWGECLVSGVRMPTTRQFPTPDTTTPLPKLRKGLSAPGLVARDPRRVRRDRRYPQRLHDSAGRCADVGLWRCSV